MWFGRPMIDHLDLVVGAQRLDVGVLARDAVAAAELLGALGAARVVGDDARAGDVVESRHVELGDEARADHAQGDWLMMSVRHRSSCVDRLQPSRGTGGMSSTERTAEDGPVALVTGAGGGIGGAVDGGARDRRSRRARGRPRRGRRAGRRARGCARRGPGRRWLGTGRRGRRGGAIRPARRGRLRPRRQRAGFGDGPVDECTEAGWDATLELNLKSVFLVCRHAVPALRAGGGGAIVTVASVLGLVGGDRDFATHAYAAARAG